MNSGKILIAEQQGIYLLKLTGDVRLTLCASISDYIERIFNADTPKEVYIDLLDAEGVDSTTLGLLAKLAIYCLNNLSMKAKLLCTNQSILRIVESMELDEIFEILGLPDMPEIETKDVTPRVLDEKAIRQQVLEAHKLLIKLNPDLLGEFVDLITSLESED